MPWFLVDDDFPTDERVLAVSLAARGLWTMAGAWASRRHTDVVPAHVLASFGSTGPLVDELTAARMLKRCRRGYLIQQEGLCRIPVQETVEKERKQKTERQRRWRENRSRRLVDASTDASTLDPDPDPRSEVDVVNHVAGRNARKPDHGLIATIKTTIKTRTGSDVDDDWAGKIAGHILDGADAHNPAAYCRRVIEADPDPRTRFLPNGGRP